MYRYFRIYENAYHYPDHFIFNFPNKPIWRKDWEWTSTFSEIFNLIKEEVHYEVKRWFYKRLLKSKIIDYSVYYKSDYKEIDTNDLQDYIFGILEDMNKTKELYHLKKMIIFGSDVAGEIFKSNHPYNTMLEIKFAKNYGDRTVYALFGIPTYFLPHISGIHILPDMTGTWEEKIQIEEKTIFGKYR